MEMDLLKAVVLRWELYLPRQHSGRFWKQYGWSYWREQELGARHQRCCFRSYKAHRITCHKELAQWFSNTCPQFTLPQSSPQAPLFNRFSSLFRECSYPGPGTLLYSPAPGGWVRSLKGWHTGDRTWWRGVSEVSGCHPGLTSLSQQCYYSLTPDSV